MPELPEVETTRRGIAPHIEQHTIANVTVRQRSLRWPVADNLESILQGQKLNRVSRRAKYLLLECEQGTLMIHLGMSGRLSVLDSTDNVGKHDHIDIEFDNGFVLRFTDPRRFGACLWTEQAIEQHKLIQHLGPEPLSDEFDTPYLSQKAKGKTTAIKTFIMNGEIVVGVGNIYANEALFMAGIHPQAAAGKVSSNRLQKLVDAIKLVLDKALLAGGTTLKDFRKSDGKPGYFAQQLNVYGRAGQACLQCQAEIKMIRQSQRATYFCPTCQKK